MQIGKNERSAAVAEFGVEGARFLGGDGVVFIADYQEVKTFSEQKDAIETGGGLEVADERLKGGFGVAGYFETEGCGLEETTDGSGFAEVEEFGDGT